MQRKRVGARSNLGSYEPTLLSISYVAKHRWRCFKRVCSAGERVAAVASQDGRMEMKAW